MTYQQICTSIFLKNDVSCFTCTDVSIQIANRLSTFKLRIKPLRRQFGLGFFGSVLVKSRSYLPSISVIYITYIFFKFINLIQHLNHINNWIIVYNLTQLRV